MSLEQQLKSGIARVNFTKVNGDQRSMLCTLLPGYIPAEEVVEPSDQHQDVLEVRLHFPCGILRMMVGAHFD